MTPRFTHRVTGILDHWRPPQILGCEITRQFPSDSIEKFVSALVDAQTDLYPHQFEMALFVFRSPPSKETFLSDEVGLSQIIELQERIFYPGRKNRYSRTIGSSAGSSDGQTQDYSLSWTRFAITQNFTPCPPLFLITGLPIRHL